jgi:hypothetical protein
VGSQVTKVAWWGKVIAGGEVIDHPIGEKNGTKISNSVSVTENKDRR